MNIFALDIGGAFIKTAFLPLKGNPKRSIVPFELWKRPRELEDVLGSLKPKREFRCAITMTGELCDCFASRGEGVGHIVRSAMAAFGHVRVFAVDGSLMAGGVAEKKYRQVASANWAAVPLFLSRMAADFLLADIGSTTTDLTPVRGGRIANRGSTDFGRLRNGDLLYTGYLRTSVAAVVREVEVRKKRVPLSAESFCQMGDVHLVLGNIGAKQYIAPTPDGAAKTVRAAKRRLARCLLADDGELRDADLRHVARQVAQAQAEQVVHAAQRFNLPVVAIGAGAFILEAAFDAGMLKRHLLMKRPGVRGLDPSLALAYLTRG